MTTSLAKPAPKSAVVAPTIAAGYQPMHEHPFECKFIVMNTTVKPILLFFFCGLTRLALADGFPADTSRKPAMPPAKKMMRQDSMNHAAMGHAMHNMMQMQQSLSMMSNLYSRNLPMNRNASGTAWHPDQTPMYMYMSHPQSQSGNPWMTMLHYSLFLRHTNQNFTNPNGRGRARQFDAPNYVMGMAQRPVGQRGLLAIKAMLSLDPLTVGKNGYPLLFQSGETYNGQRLIDRQHQHDLFSELSVGYSYALSPNADVFGYVGYPGEPALGPPAFMHRISSFNNPDSPLGHHWTDATHITFGIATAGFRYKIAKLEVSSFTGREPNENRFGFDRPRFDSYSYRLSVNPSPSLALQFSQGYINSPEAIDPDHNITRTTASLLHSKSLGRPDRYVSSALVWGMNSHDGENESAYLAESSLQLGRTALYGRYENITKSVDELGLRDYFTDLQANDTEFVTINSLTLGINYRLLQIAGSDMAVGAQLTGHLPDRALEPVYGKTPLSGQIYLRFTPSLMPMLMPGNHTKHH
ncbi:hypothetical protein ACO2Q8_15385 [Larkinella sp. VNQ87]|uniref:hypothetical protein n=1 Tax=Larkinella sp. VNQ87 TaxID=3400921 RepID=UPI003C0733C7